MTKTISRPPRLVTSNIRGLSRPIKPISSMKSDVLSIHRKTKAPRLIVAKFVRKMEYTRIVHATRKMKQMIQANMFRITPPPSDGNPQKPYASSS